MLAGSRPTARTKVQARTARPPWGRSKARKALDSQNIITARATEGEAPTSQR